MFLSVAVSNATFMLRRWIAKLSRGPLERFADIHQVCTFFRQRGAASLLLEGTAHAYHVNTMQSAAAYLMELRRVDDAAKVTSFAKPLFDAVSSGYWDAARAMAQASRMTWNEASEYEDDFLYVLFWLQFALLEAPRSDCTATLDRYEAVLEGARDIRLEICRALLDSDVESFDVALTALLSQRAVDVTAMIERNTMSDDAAAWLRHFALEGLALLKLADRVGLARGTDYLHCPNVLHADSPFRFDPDAWRQVDFVPSAAPPVAE